MTWKADVLRLWRRFGRAADSVIPNPSVFEANRPMLRPASAVVGPGVFAAGRHSYWDASARFMTYKSADSIGIGAYTSISPDVRIIAGGKHDSRQLAQFPFSLLHPDPGDPEPQDVEHVLIGSDVWIGTGAILVGPLIVGNGAVIGAGAVVTRDVPQYAVVVGAPARPVKMRHTGADIAELNMLRWWDWPDESILEAEPLLRSGEVAKLAEYARERGLPRMKGTQ